GLAPEAEGENADEVGSITDLAGGVSGERELRVRAPHPMSVIRNADQRASAVLDLHTDVLRPGIEGVFDQLLRDRRRTLDHLTRRDLVGHPVWEDGDPSTHNRITSD